MTTDNEVQQVSPQAHRSGWTQHPAIRRITKLVIAAVVVAGLAGLVQPAVAPAVAQAAVFQGPDQLGWGRAAILFNRDETRQIGLGAAPGGLPSGNPAVMAFNIARMGLAAIAMNYYNRGLCSAYAWSVRPWDNQGFMSRKC